MNAPTPFPGCDRISQVLECQRGGPRLAALSRDCQGEQDQGEAENLWGGAEMGRGLPIGGPGVNRWRKGLSDGFRRTASGLGGT